MSKKVLVTGSAGFIFSNFIRYAIHTGEPYTFVSIDKLVNDINRKNIYLNLDHKFYLGDISNKQFVHRVFQIEKPDIVINAAAESFVDDSINNASPFITSNILGTQIIIDNCIKYNVEKLIQISTDEIYGQLECNEDISWEESAPPNPRNPYSTTKASAELLVKAAHTTHGLNYIITRSCNNFGPRQSKKNLIPKTIKCIIENKPIPIYGNGLNEREWIYVIDHCIAILRLLKYGKSNEIYNIGTQNLLPNLDLVNKICTKMGSGHNLISHIDNPRPGHDFKYHVNSNKITELGWAPKFKFMDALDKTISWYLSNKWVFNEV